MAQLGSRAVQISLVYHGSFKTEATGSLVRTACVWLMFLSGKTCQAFKNIHEIHLISKTIFEQLSFNHFC